MKTIVSIIGASGIGCTFADWSVQFLSGQSRYFQAETAQWKQLPDNPVGEFNAHHHPKNHPLGLHACLTTLNLFEQTPGEVFSVYLGGSSRESIAEELGISDVYKDHAQIDSYLKTELAEIWKQYNDRGARNVYIRADHEFSLRTLTTRSIPDPTAKVDAYLNKTTNFYNGFFPHRNFDQLPAWDQRELLALDMRPHKIFSVLDKIDLSLPHCFIDGQEWVTQGELAMTKIMEFCDLPVLSDRLEAWRPVYHQWQRIQAKPMSFAFRFEHIVKSVVNGWYCPIDLTFHQEAAVQHSLIFDYGLNLRNWGLTKFPDNTQKLHKLLEANTHPIEQA
jgi:hypothetical protein